MVPENVVEDKLNNMGDDKHGTERVQVDVEAVSPLHVLPDVLILNQILVGQIPEERGNHKAHRDTVHEEKVQQELEEGPEAQVKVEGEHERGQTKPSGQKDQKRWVIAGELTLRFFAVVEIFVHLLRRYEQVHHLPKGELKVHLIELEEPPHIEEALGRGRHAGLVGDRRGEEGAGRVLAVRGTEEGATGAGPTHSMGASLALSQSQFKLQSDTRKKKEKARVAIPKKYLAEILSRTPSSLTT